MFESDLICGIASVAHHSQLNFSVFINCLNFANSSPPSYSSSNSSTMSTHRTAWSSRSFFFEIASFASSCSFSSRHRETFVVAKVSSGHSVAVCRPSLLSPITPSPSSQGSSLVVLLSQVIYTFVFTCDHVVKTRSQALHQIVVEVFFRRVSSVLLFFLYCVHYFVAGFSAVVLWARTQSSFVKCLALFCGLRNRSNSCNTQIWKSI